MIATKVLQQNETPLLQKQSRKQATFTGDIRKTGVYLLTNTVTGDKYVGSTAHSFHRRWTTHLRLLRNGTHENQILQRAFSKYGEEHFVFSVEHVCPPEQCVEQEQDLLSRLLKHDASSCYNISPTAGSVFGLKHTETSKHKMSLAKKGRPITEETRRKISTALRGRVFTPEQKQNMSLAQKGKPKSRESVLKMSASLRGRRLSPEHIEKVRQTSTGRKHSAETKLKCSLAKKGLVRTPEHSANIAKGLVGKKQSEETVMKRVASRKGYKHSAETRAKMSAARLRTLNAEYTVSQ